MSDLVLWLDKLRMSDLGKVGGKNSSLGEMIGNLSKLGVSVPGGFATTSHAFQQFIAQSGLADRIQQRLVGLDVENVAALTTAGTEIRRWLVETPLLPDLDIAVRAAYQKLCEQAGSNNIAVAVRSSATAEDLPDASFAGQQETFLNVVGADDVILKMKEVFASLYNDRAIAYRVHQGFAHEDVFLSAGVQLMVRSDVGSSGVLFTLDTESGFRNVVFVTSSYGLGEMVVQGAVNPDEFYVYKPTLNAGKPAILRRQIGAKQQRMVYSDQPGERVRIEETPAADRNRFSLSDEDVHELSRQSLVIEDHYQRPMDIEWAKDGNTGRIYIVQARPETVKSRTRPTQIERYNLLQKGTAVLAEGRSIGQKIGAGKARVVRSIKDMARVEPGDVLVADMTDPDWEPIMKIASAIVTNSGGRTCHAAIISRELGIPCIVGTRNATEQIKSGKEVTVSCAEGESGYIYEGVLKFEVKKTDLKNLKRPKNVKIMMNLGEPEQAFTQSLIPNDGVGLAREEFVINNSIRVHPMALLAMDGKVKDVKIDRHTAKVIDKITYGYKDKTEFFVDKLAQGIGKLGAAFYPKDVIVRFSDFKTNEYANLIGGQYFEPKEENPMIGWRGASRYYDEKYAAAFALECEAIKRVREKFGLTNVIVMIPFCRTLDEGKKVIEIMKKFGLERGKNGLRVYVMAEIPANIILVDEFAKIFDGFSIGSNDLTQLTLGLDRDNGTLSHIGNEKNEAVKILIRQLIAGAHKRKRKVGICGQAPSDFPEYAEWLMKEGIDSISVTPDTILKTTLNLSSIGAKNKATKKKK